MAQEGHYEAPYTHGLWKYFCHPENLTLVFENFGIKHKGLDNAQI